GCTCNHTKALWFLLLHDITRRWCLPPRVIHLLLFVFGKRHIDSATGFFGWALGSWVYVDVEDVGWQPQGRAGVGDVDHAADVPLYRCTAENRVSLGFAVTKFGQVVDCIQTRLAIGNVHVEVMLLAVFTDRDTFEDQVVIVFRCNRAWLEERIF